jgi:hypothetical protein
MVLKFSTQVETGIGHNNYLADGGTSSAIPTTLNTYCFQRPITFTWIAVVFDIRLGMGGDGDFIEIGLAVEGVLDPSTTIRLDGPQFADNYRRRRLFAAPITILALETFGVVLSKVLTFPFGYGVTVTLGTD